MTWKSTEEMSQKLQLVKVKSFLNAIFVKRALNGKWMWWCIKQVSNCWNFTAGKCDFQEKDCWFRHNETASDYKFKCRSCEDIFDIRAELKKHQKVKHVGEVPNCKNYENKDCKFGNENCWYKHDNENETNDKDIIQKVFEMWKKWLT